MLRNYEAFLTTKGTVKPQYIQYYLKWVSIITKTNPLFSPILVHPLFS